MSERENGNKGRRCIKYTFSWLICSFYFFELLCGCVCACVCAEWMDGCVNRKTRSKWESLFLRMWRRRKLNIFRCYLRFGAGFAGILAGGMKIFKVLVLKLTMCFVFEHLSHQPLMLPVNLLIGFIYLNFNHFWLRMSKFWWGKLWTWEFFWEFWGNCTNLMEDNSSNFDIFFLKLEAFPWNFWVTPENFPAKIQKPLKFFSF